MKHNYLNLKNKQSLTKKCKKEEKKLLFRIK